MRSPTSQRSMLNYIGLCILLAGLSVSSFVYWHGPHDDSVTDDDETAFSSDDSRAYKNAMEKNVGAFGLLEAQWSESLAKLGEPTPLAITILVVAGLAAGGCFRLATRFAPRGTQW